MRLIAILMFISLLTSCNFNNKPFETELIECFNSKILKKTSDSSFNVFKEAIKFENLLIENGIIRNNSKEEYLRLFNKVENNEVFIDQDIKKSISSFYFTLSPFTIDLFYACPKEILRKEENKANKKLLSLVLLYDNIQDTGVGNLGEVKNLIMSIDKVDFRNTVYRCPVTIILLMNLYNSCCGEKLENLKILD